MPATPIEIGQWRAKPTVHSDSASIVGSTLLLDKLSRSAVYEIHSIRAHMNASGTTTLASMGISDGEVPVGVGNDDNALLAMAREAENAQERPDVFWFWGRSQQNQGPENAPVMLPPEFYWTGEMHGVFQNGAGATVLYLWTVVYRIVRFRDEDFANITHKVMPAGSTKHDSTT